MADLTMEEKKIYISKNVNLIDWSSSKLLRVTKSTFASELYAFE